MKSIINVRCPECGGTLEIDVAREKVLSHRPKGSDGKKKKDKSALFDEVVKRVKHREGEAEDSFRAATDALANREKELDALFGEVKKKIEKEKGKKYKPEDDPRNIFWD